jgi:mannosyltransferase
MAHVETAVDNHAPRQALLSRAAARAAHASQATRALGVAAVSLALGLFQLGQPSLWVDESFTARAMKFSYTRLVHEHHWLYYTLMKPWVAVAGTSEIALRLPSVVAAAAACALLVPLGDRLLGRPVGTIAGLVLALNAFVVQWSQQARSYSFVLLGAVVATMALVRLERDRTRRAWLLYTAALGGLLLFQPLSAGLLAAAHALAARGSRLRVVAAGIAVVVLASPYLIGVYRRDSEGGTLVWNKAADGEAITRALLELSGAVGIGLILALCALAVVRRGRWLLVSWAIAPFAIALALTPVADVFIDRYLIVSAPAFALLVAVALDRLRGPWRVGAVGTLALGLVAGLLIWYAPDGSDNWTGQDWKAATRFAMARGGATVDPTWARSVYWYYGGVEADNGLYLALAGFGGGPQTALEATFGEDLRVERR